MELLSIIPSVGLLLDVGCDHGYTSIEAVRRGIAKRAIASDVNKGPLLRAKEHIELSGLSERIDTVLSDGLRAIEKGVLIPKDKEDNVLLISGMGGELMSRILWDGEEKTRLFRYLLLSPQSEPELLRKELIYRLGYHIVLECYIKDSGRYYVMIRAEKGAEKENYNEAELLFGRRELQEDRASYEDYLDFTERLIAKAIEKASAGGSEKTKERISELKKLRGLIATAR